MGTNGRSTSGGVKREAAIAARQPIPNEGLDDRGWQWLEARKPKILEGKPKFDRLETEVVAEKNVMICRALEKGSVQTPRRRMCSVQPLGPKSMEAVSEACPLS